MLRGTPIEQVPQFNYLGAEISAKRDLKQEVRTQVMKAACISGCLYNLIWSNKYTGLFISPSVISELDCATNKTDTAERSISIGRESLQVFFVLGALAYFQVPPLGVVVKKNGVHSE